MSDIGEKINMSQVTVHHTIGLLDLYFSSPGIVLLGDSEEQVKKQLRLYTMTCFFISAKYNEKDSRGPTAKDIHYIMKQTLSEQEIIECEIVVMKAIDWNLFFSTTADFVHLFINQGVVFTDDQILANGSFDIP